MDLIEKAIFKAGTEFGRESPSFIPLEPVANTHQPRPDQIPDKKKEIRRGRKAKHASAILIVDDERGMCTSLMAILQNSGYQAVYASSGKSALKYINQRKFDLIISDIHMPGLNGFELLKQFKITQPGIPVVMMTGDATVDSAIKALRMGAYDYLKKPFEPEVLLKTIDNALKQKRLIKQTHILDNRLKLSERRFRFMLDSTPDFIYTLDNSGKFKYVKESAARNIGYRSADLIGRKYDSIVSETSLQAARWHFNERRTGQRATSGLQLYLKPGPLQSDTTSDNSSHAVELYATGVYRMNRPKSKVSHHIGTYGVIRFIPRNGNEDKNLQKAQKIDESFNMALQGIGQDLEDLLSSTQGVTTDLKKKLMDGGSPFKQIRSIETNLKKSREKTLHLLKIANGENPEESPVPSKAGIRKITFKLKKPNANQVFLAGDFNNWNIRSNPMQKESNGIWKTTLVLPTGKYEYKFLVDGQWRESLADELTAPNKFGTFNNLVNVGEK